MGSVFDPQMELVVTRLEAVLADPTDAAWAEAARAFAAVEDEDDDVELALELQDVDHLRAVVEEWQSGKRVMLLHDRDVLKRALKAYRKSLKVTRLAEESSISGGDLSSGRQSSISGIRPPVRYPLEVWRELARQNRLVAVGHGLYELPPGG